MKKVVIALTVLIILGAIAIPVAVNAYSGIPSFSIVSVIPDQKVTIQTSNFPAGYDFKVLLGAYGSLGIGGTQIDTTNSGAGGAFQVTYTIPAAFQGKNPIAIRLESTTGGFFAYNWFANSTSATAVPTSGPTATPAPVVLTPTFAITAVTAGTNVTIKTANFPAGYDFKVLIGAYGTLGVGGTEVATVNSGTGGTFTATYNIPAALASASRLAIRLQSTTGGFFAYNWFWNSTGAVSPTVTPGPTSVPGYSGFPTIAVSAVVANTSVTIKGSNFPANIDFKVLVGAYGTLGVGGTQVGTFNSGAGGTFTATYTLPAAFSGVTPIAIRVESTSGRFFAYNWFWNTTTP
jgi:hypothetical protein